MNPLSIAFLLVLQTAANPKVTIPWYPPMAFRGGTVVAVIEGKPRSAVSILYAEEPFAGPVQEALKEWRFPGEDSNRDILVVVNFRDFFVPFSRSIDCPQPKPHLPAPTFIADPEYPENTMTAGLRVAVVARMKISTSGSVKTVDVIHGVDEFNQSVVGAVKQWKFRPARDRFGKATESEAYAVCVWRPLNRRNSDFSPSGP